ncbi:hypothetical protein WAI453_008430 [Rhynchosporium graminicola]
MVRVAVFPSLLLRHRLAENQDILLVGIPEEGGCFPGEYQCTTNGCIPMAGLSGIGTCSTGYHLCPASLNFGCLLVAGEVGKVTPSQTPTTKVVASGSKDSGLTKPQIGGIITIRTSEQASSNTHPAVIKLGTPFHVIWTLSPKHKHKHKYNLHPQPPPYPNPSSKQSQTSTSLPTLTINQPTNTPRHTRNWSDASSISEISSSALTFAELDSRADGERKSLITSAFSRAPIALVMGSMMKK